MARRKQIVLLTVALVLGFFVFGKSSSRVSMEKEISSSLQPNPAWMIPSPDPAKQQQLQHIFSTPLTFLGKGAQSYAFASSDGKYVVKFFKMRRFTPSFADSLCPHVVRRRLRNLNWVFNGYKTAYDHFREETGLIFIHLAKTQNLNCKATLIDAAGEQFTLDLDSTEFVVQEKAELIFAYLDRLYRQGKNKEAEKAIAQVFQIVKHRMAEGYADRDKGVSNNYGFVGDRAIQLDIGRLYKGSKPGQLEHVEKRIERWQHENQLIFESNS